MGYLTLYTGWENEAEKEVQIGKWNRARQRKVFAIVKRIPKKQIKEIYKLAASSEVVENTDKYVVYKF